MMLSGSSACLIWRITAKPLAMLGLKELDLAAAHPMLAGAGAFHGYGAVNKPLVKAFDPCDFRLVQRIAEQHHMEIAIAHMADDGTIKIVCAQIFLGCSHAFRKPRNGNADIGGKHILLARRNGPCRPEGIMAGLPQLLPVLLLFRPFEGAAAIATWQFPETFQSARAHRQQFRETPETGSGRF